MKDRDITFYTKDKGRCEFNEYEWRAFDVSTITYHSEGDLPTLTWFNGNKVWYKNDKIHRANGKLAIEGSNSCGSYWIDGIHYSQEDYKAIIDEVNNMHPALRLTDPRWWVRDMESNN